MPPTGLNVNLMTHSVRPSDRFDERVVGLDDLSFRVRDRSELEHRVAHFDALGVGHSSVVNAHFGSTLVFRDPDNIHRAPGRGSARIPFRGRSSRDLTAPPYVPGRRLLVR